MRDYLEGLNILTDAEIEWLYKQGVKKEIKKGEFFIRQGAVSDEVAFVNSGIFRSFYYSSGAEDVTYCLLFENSFVTAYSSFITQEKTQENIQALTDAEVIVFRRTLFNELESTGGNWLRLLKYFAEAEFVRMEKRFFLFQKESAEKRYEDLINNHAEFLQLVPLNYLASYLGITQRHLSRIRKAMTN
ncbi:Crp/Fnr family transcriptional regulator [Fulvivirga sediminis]|uniref:Crp/Fnr family transcriptional regulator n=1 Tax=Fulvivirga sediminis TaxID=2803949 RepID=A0A937K2S4_9BACT|nr:Crp/Fnr family transcriptional regulator [Fulvivirga sediminis]MBL3658916.1 Crp/Fnr family transcriptional regulator [Fulvivirga sediminis]